MKTFSFIGSDKNAGKTTAFNFVCQEMTKAGDQHPVCVTSIGINGEDTDTYEGRPKPKIRITRGSYFVTAGEHLKHRTGRYETLLIFDGLVKPYILGRSLSDFEMVLEGPNTGMELLALKDRLRHSGVVNRLLIDGSIDRQFLARPAISDGFYFALLISNRDAQIQKAHDLLFSLSLPTYDGTDARTMERILQENRKDETRSLLLDENREIVYLGHAIPSLDTALREICLKQREKPLTLYLNGALTRTLHGFLSPFRHMRIILDNFSLYQNISVKKTHGKRFMPALSLRHSVRVEKIFLKIENGSRLTSLIMPERVSTHNLFREYPDEIGI